MSTTLHIKKGYFEKDFHKIKNIPDKDKKSLTKWTEHKGPI